MIRNSITSYTSLTLSLPSRYKQSLPDCHSGAVLCVNHQYSAPTIYQWGRCTYIFEKSFDFLFFNFRQHAEGAQRPCHLHNDEHSRLVRIYVLVCGYLPSLIFI